MYPEPTSLWKYAADVGITMFGTSARYLTAVASSDDIREKMSMFDLSALKIIASTGSPATEAIFQV